MRIESSDRYFIEKVRPRITRKAINAAIRPLGFSTSGKGQTFPKEGQVSLFLRPNTRKYDFIEMTLNGSYQIVNDGIGCVYSRYGNATDEWCVSYSGRPQRDADRFVRGIRDSVKAWIAYWDRRD